MDVEVDRLSSLPDDLIHKILSFIDIEYAIRSSILSSRWRFIWNSMSILNFSCFEVSLREGRPTPYHESVKKVISGSNAVSSVSLKLDEEDAKSSSMERILEYVFSHNVQQLTISSVREYGCPLPLLSSKSLKHLTIVQAMIDCCSDYHWDLRVLTTLHLQNSVQLNNFCSILAMCQNLKNLTLEGCQVFEHEESDGFSIINSQLVNLTLKKVKWYVHFLLVNTPQLKNLIFVDTPPGKDAGGCISESPGGLKVSAHDLTYLHIKGYDFQKLSLDCFSSLEKADLCISSPQKTDVHKICALFQCLRSVKSLALNLEIVELLSSSIEVVSNQPSPFASLKSLKVYPLKSMNIYPFQNLRNSEDFWFLNYDLLDGIKNPTQLDKEKAGMEINLSTEVKNYLLDGSPNAAFTRVSHEFRYEHGQHESM